MKLKPTDREAFDKLRPGTLTAQGFLGSDPRPPEEIVAEDEAEFARLGLSFDEAAEALSGLAEAGGRGLGEPVTLGRLLVQSGETRGVLPCPWGDGVFHKNATSLRPVDLSPEACVDGEDGLVYSELSVHLLKAHHFCQGRGSPFRLEPATLAKLLRGQP